MLCEDEGGDGESSGSCDRKGGRAHPTPPQAKRKKRTKETRPRHWSHGGGRRLKERETTDGDRGLAFR